ncbi:MAG: hypothetical protein AMJ81_14495 [Phycisphaerae bacterium SM23_33]|nr:MAG: hypothetical protein AMJ81_14495 [Phycisphaerae bacterium SM23_33]
MKEKTMNVSRLVVPKSVKWLLATILVLAAGVLLGGCDKRGVIVLHEPRLHAPARPGPVVVVERAPQPTVVVQRAPQPTVVVQRAPPTEIGMAGRGRRPAVSNRARQTAVIRIAVRTVGPGQAVAEAVPVAVAQAPSLTRPRGLARLWVSLREVRRGHRRG